MPVDIAEQSLFGSAVGTLEFADTLTEFGPSNSGDLVDHEPAGGSETGLRSGFNEEPEQRRVSGISGERAERDAAVVEPVLLADDRWS